MARLLFEKTARRWALAAGSVPLVMLLGCPKEPPAAPGKVPAQATAPAATAAPNTSPAQTAQADTQEQQAVAAKAARDQELINKAEAAYRSGVDNYRAG